MFEIPRARALAATVAIAGLALLAAPALAAGPAAKATDLAWMTGTWKGTFGPGTLEETWNRPDGGSIAALVRGTGGGEMNMIELIVIEEAEGSLVLRLQQWNPGYVPRAPEPQEMQLVEIGENRAAFEAVGEGGLNKLTYSRPADDTFVLEVETAAGQTLTLELAAQ